MTIDHISEERMATAGRADLAQRLDKPRLRHMIDLIERIADMALEHGVTPVIHQHAGCYIEFADEVELVAAALDPRKVGFCIDTGHMAYAGIDPVDFYRRHTERVKYFHFKDIDRNIHARALAEGIPFLDAVAQKISARSSEASSIGRVWPRLFARRVFKERQPSSRISTRRSRWPRSKTRRRASPISNPSASEAGRLQRRKR